ncbi:MAG: serine/threonine protein kinase [Planctomycetes bacterium]|nr:serine/threonine protein kinase [Planctomycetota bacterium]
MAEEKRTRASGSSAASSAEEEALREVLTQAFLARESGSEPDWLALARGDEGLAARARAVAGGCDRVTAPLGSRRTGADEAGTGRRLGDFEIIDLIGSGGMSRVHLARQVSLDRLVALKLLDAGLARDPGRRARFRREAEITASLDHPAIVPIHGVGEIDGLPYIAMKLLEGPTLDALARPLEPRRVAELGIVIAEALHHAHVEGVIHRDVKPSNVVVENGRPILLDFGLAWAFGRVDLTAPDRAPGTLAYMSPEQLEGSRGLDPRTDLYSLAVTLWELLADRPLHRGDTPGAIIHQILHHDAPALGLGGRDRDLETILTKAMARDRELRYRTAQDLADDLRRFRDGRPILARRVSLAGRLLLAGRRHPRLALGTASGLVVLLGLAATLGFLHWRERDRIEGLARRVEQEYRRGELATAAALGAGLPEAGYAPLLRRIESRRALEELRDRVIDFSSLKDPRRLGRLLDRSRLPEEDPEVLPSAMIVLAGASIMIAEPEAALRWLDRRDERFGPSRASAAFRRLLSERRLVDLAELPPISSSLDAGARADEHLFTALAANLGGAAMATREGELDRCFASVPNHRGGRQLAARIAFEKGDYAAALAHSRGIDPRGEPGPVVVRSIARCLLRLDRSAEARALLERFPPPADDPGSAVVLLELSASLADDAAFEAGLARAVSSWPALGVFQLLAATRDFNRGRIAEAAAAAGRALALELDDQERLAAQIVLGNARLVELGFAERLVALPADDARRAEVETLLDDLDRAAASLSPGLAVTRDRGLSAARLLILLGREAEARRLIEATGQDHPHDPEPVLLLARLTDRDCLAAAGNERRLPATWSGHDELDRSVARLGALADELAPGSAQATAILLLVRLSYWAEDWEGFDRWAARFESSGGALATDQNLRVVAALRRRADKLR